MYGCGTEAKSPGILISPHFTERARLVPGTCLSVHKIIAICHFRYLDSFEHDKVDSDDELLSIKLAVVHNVEQRLFSLPQRTTYDRSHFFGFSEHSLPSFG
jgi:hypothetical protein